MRTIVLTALFATVSGAALAQQAGGDPTRGHNYATMVCATCHSIEKAGSPSPNPTAPVWRDIANTPGMTAAALTVFLSTPHKNMPDLIIPLPNMQDLVAYILTLKSVPPI